MTEAKMAETAKHVFEVYIQTTPERLWQALTDGEISQKYFFGTRVESDWNEGSGYKYFLGGPTGEDMLMVDGNVIEADPPKKLVMTFNHHWGEGEQIDYPETLLTWEITPMGGACRLVLVHDRLEAGHPMTREFFGGWSLILSGLKTYLETGEPLAMDPADAAGK